MKKWRFLFSFYWYKFLRKIGLKTDEIYYIGGSEALPPPLTKEEEEILIQKLPEGDETARSMLIERNLASSFISRENLKTPASISKT